MIIETIVTTLNPDGTPNVAPMGPRLIDGLDRFLLRPFRTSTTYANLARTREGVLHLTDDALLFARTAIGHKVNPPMRPAEAVAGRILVDACRHVEFRVTGLDETDDRVAMTAEAVARGRSRDFLGYNRARNAIIEAAVIATRADWLPVGDLAADLDRHRVVVEKTGGGDEREALTLLEDHIRSRVEARGESWPGPER